MFAHAATQNQGKNKNHSFTTAAMGEAQTHNKPPMEVKVWFSAWTGETHTQNAKLVWRQTYTPPEHEGSFTRKLWVTEHASQLVAWVRNKREPCAWRGQCLFSHRCVGRVNRKTLSMGGRTRTALCESEKHQTKEHPHGRVERIFLLPHVMWRGRVRWWSGHVGKDWQSYHTHHYSAITSPKQQEFKWVVDTWKSPNGLTG